MTFEKAYTREFTLVMGEVWLESFRRMLPELQKPGLETPYFIVRKNAANEYWEDAEQLQRFSDAMLIEHEKGRAFYERHVALYEHAVVSLREYESNVPENLEAFIRMVGRIIEGCVGWNVMYYTALDERTPVDILEDARRLRALDRLGDDSDEYLRRGLARLFPGLHGLERAMSLSELHLSEMLNTLLEARERGSIICIQDDVLRILPQSLDTFESEHPEIHFKKESVSFEIRDVKGQVGYPGVARGRVRIVRKREEASMVAEGDIVVSPMTTPHFLEAIKRAAAIVTDEGGITCHAAILAREMKKPCVVGTRFATQVFKSGDMVEVDADKGVVRLLTF